MIIVVAASIICLGTTPGAALSDFAGAWRCRLDGVAEARGMITVEASGDDLMAEFSGVGVALNGQGRFDFGDQGCLTLLPQAAAPVQLAYWTQPASPLLGMSYTTPVALAQVGDNRWAGAIDPLDDAQTLWLLIDHPDGDAAQARIINHERNLGAAWGVERVERSEDGAVALIAGSRRFAAELEEGSLIVEAPGFGSLRFAPVDASTVPELAAWRRRGPLTTPGSLGDGWAVASPESVGLRSEPIVAMLDALGAEAGQLRSLRLHSLQIARGGRLVVDEHFFGRGPNDLHDMRSAAKSLSALVLGVALEQSSVSIDAPLADLLHEHRELLDTSAKRGITVRHALSMQTGLAANDNDPASPGGEDRMQSQLREPDWTRYTLSLPVVATPGEAWAYSSGSVNLTGAVVRAVTGEWQPAYFESALAHPLGISHWRAPITPTGDGYFGGGVWMRPRDFLKLGQLVLDKGRWAGGQVVSEAWIERMTAPQARVDDDREYALGWWRREFRFGDRAVLGIGAVGNGGQVMYAFPSLDLVVLFTAGNYGDYRAWRQIEERLIPEHILPAAMPSG